MKTTLKPNIKTEIFIFLLIYCSIFLILSNKSVKASYAGDNNIITYKHGVLNGGDIYYSLGNSSYSGEIQNDESYTVLFEVNYPKDAKIIIARLYFYWIWSKRDNVGVFPEVSATFYNKYNSWNNLNIDSQYWDTKGFVGLYDYYGGVYCYDVSEFINGSIKHYITIKNSATDGRTFCTQGILLLILYEQTDNGEKIEYWINEGFDTLYAEYGITPDMATTSTVFEGEIDLKNIIEAKLITIAPSAGYYSNSQNSAPNRLLINYEEPKLPDVIHNFLKLLFGDVLTSGKKWENVYHASERVQIGIDCRNVSKYLKSKDNVVQIQDNGDYFCATNAILLVRYSDINQNNLFSNAIINYLPYFVLFALGIPLLALNVKNKVLRRFNYFGLSYMLIFFPFIIISFISYSTYGNAYYISPFSFNYLFPITYLLIPSINLVYFFNWRFKKFRKKKKSIQITLDLEELNKFERIEDYVFKNREFDEKIYSKK
ncbi:MAG: DUF3344 domain-containing protein [Promethearchaeia archaeon]